MEKKPIGAFDKISVFTLVNVKGYQKIPVYESASTDSMNLPSAVRSIPDREQPTKEFLEFQRYSQIGLDEIQNRFFRKPFTATPFFEPPPRSAYKEIHGGVKGIVQDLHYRYFEVGYNWKPEDFKEPIVFLPLKELEDRMRAEIPLSQNHEDKNFRLDEIEMSFGGLKDKRINRGITDAIEEYWKKKK